MHIRYWSDRELQIYCSSNTFGIFINLRDADGRWGFHREVIHLRIENLKGRSG